MDSQLSSSKLLEGLEAHLAQSVYQARNDNSILQHKLTMAEQANELMWLEVTQMRSELQTAKMEHRTEQVRMSSLYPVCVQRCTKRRQASGYRAYDNNHSAAVACHFVDDCSSRDHDAKRRCPTLLTICICVCV